MLDGGLFIAVAVASAPGTVEQSIIEEQVLTNSSADFYSRYKTRPHMHTFDLQNIPSLQTVVAEVPFNVVFCDILVGVLWYTMIS